MSNLPFCGYPDIQTANVEREKLWVSPQSDKANNQNVKNRYRHHSVDCKEIQNINIYKHVHINTQFRMIWYKKEYVCPYINNMYITTYNPNTIFLAQTLGKNIASSELRLARQFFFLTPKPLIVPLFLVLPGILLMYHC